MLVKAPSIRRRVRKDSKDPKMVGEGSIPYEELVFRGAFALPVVEQEADSLIGLFCTMMKIRF